MSNAPLDNMAAIRKLHPDFSAGNDTSKHMDIAYSYATAVFLALALETFLLLTYRNSVALLYNWKHTIPSFLERRLNEKKQTKTIGSLDIELRSLSVVNLSETEKWFDEIYEKNLFGRTIGAKRYKKFRAKFADLISTRNSIVHRGGESKKGDFIEIGFDELETLRLEVEDFGRNLASSILEWWLKQLQRDPLLASAV